MYGFGAFIFKMVKFYCMKWTFITKSFEGVAIVTKQDIFRRVIDLLKETS